MTQGLRRIPAHLYPDHEPEPDPHDNPELDLHFDPGAPAPDHADLRLRQPDRADPGALPPEPARPERLRLAPLAASPQQAAPSRRLFRLPAYMYLALCLAGPPALLALAWRARTRADLILLAGVATVMATDRWLASPWSTIGRNWRPIWAAACGLEAAMALGRIAHLPGGMPGVGSVALAVAALAGVDQVRRMLVFVRRPRGAVRLSFPLERGRYAIAQGGPAPLNTHTRLGGQRYALDLVRLRGPGKRARGLYPRALERYAIFGRTVRSPCSGTVVAAVDGFRDIRPPGSAREFPPGNYLAIRNPDGLLVVMAHLQHASLLVAPGDTVRAGDRIARVGSSGNTAEPHLHIHAERNDQDEPGTGEGVPIAFAEAGGRQLRRNDVVVSSRLRVAR